MQVIHDKDGNVIHRSRNMRGIQRYVSNHYIKVLSVDRLSGEQGKLCILFEDGSSYEQGFASFTCLCWIVARWRNVQGAHLLLNGKESGILHSKSFQ